MLDLPQKMNSNCVNYDNGSFFGRLISQQSTNFQSNHENNSMLRHQTIDSFIGLKECPFCSNPNLLLQQHS